MERMREEWCQRMWPVWLWPVRQRPGLPGKSFKFLLTFLASESLFSQFPWEAFLAFFCPKMPFSECIFAKKLLGPLTTPLPQEGIIVVQRRPNCGEIDMFKPPPPPPSPTCGMGRPPHPSHAPHNEVLQHFVPSCPIQKFSSNQKKPKNTNLWLKPWLHVTYPDHKEYLWVYRHLSVA